MIIKVRKIEHENLISNNENLIPYMEEAAGGKLREYLDTLNDPIYVNCILRYTKNQIVKYRKWQEGLNKYNGDKDRAMKNGYVQAARPGYSAHEWGHGFDASLQKTLNWDSKKSDLEAYGYEGIKSEAWHIHYLDGYRNNEDYVLSKLKEVLSIEEMMQVINKYGYGNLSDFQKDFGLQPDGVIGPHTSLQIRLLNKEYEFVE